MEKKIKRICSYCHKNKINTFAWFFGVRQCESCYHNQIVNVRNPDGTYLFDGKDYSCLSKDFNQGDKK